jgi:hypothetical protein
MARRWKSVSTLPAVATQGFEMGGLVHAVGCGWSMDFVTPPKYGGAGGFTDGKAAHE